MKLSIIICWNEETLCSNGQYQLTQDADRMREVVDAGADKCFELTGDLPEEYDSHFRNWHGGRHDQFRARCGFVSIPSEFRDTGLFDIAMEINDAMLAKLEQIEAEEEAFEAENEVST